MYVGNDKRRVGEIYLWYQGSHRGPGLRLYQLSIRSLKRPSSQCQNSCKDFNPSTWQLVSSLIK